MLISNNHMDLAKSIQSVYEDIFFHLLNIVYKKYQNPNLTLSGGHDVLLRDTVGFISDLPTELVAAFSATLEEVTNADMILHVRDISHPEADSQFKNVVDILENLGALDNKDIIEVWNKSDLLSEQDQGR